MDCRVAEQHARVERQAKKRELGKLSKDHCRVSEMPNCTPRTCVPGTPGPRPLPPYPYLYTGFPGTDTRLVHFATADPWPPIALPVPIPLHWSYRYGYAAGHLGFRRTPAPVRYRSYPCGCNSTLVLPVRIHSWLSLRTEERRVQFTLSLDSSLPLSSLNRFPGSQSSYLSLALPLHRDLRTLGIRRALFG